MARANPASPETRSGGNERAKCESNGALCRNEHDLCERIPWRSSRGQTKLPLNTRGTRRSCTFDLHRVRTELCVQTKIYVRSILLPLTPARSRASLVLRLPVETLGSTRPLTGFSAARQLAGSETRPLLVLVPVCSAQQRTVDVYFEPA